MAFRSAVKSICILTCFCAGPTAANPMHEGSIHLRRQDGSATSTDLSRLMGAILDVVSMTTSAPPTTDLAGAIIEVATRSGDAAAPTETTTESTEDGVAIEEWCANLDAESEAALVDLWEHKGVSLVLDGYTRKKEKDWLENLVNEVLPNSGNLAPGSCGVIGSECDFSLDCRKMASEGRGAEYWILSAVEGLHRKLGVVHEYLQDTVINNTLLTATISQDFSAPDSTGMNGLSIVASLLSAGIFLGGSVTGLAGVLANEAALAAKAASNAAQATLRKAIRDMDAKKINEQSNLLKAARAAETKWGTEEGGVQRVTSARGAGLWTTASCFTMISAFSDPEGQVEQGDLEPQLLEMFKAAREQIVALGSRALGRGNDDYLLLPGANDTDVTGLSDDSYVAGFFRDGKFLASESNPTFNKTIEDSYGAFTAKIVDQALQTAGFRVFALTELDSEASCYDEEHGAGYGAKWIDALGDGTFLCMQLHRKVHGKACDSEHFLTSCDWEVAETDVIDKLEDSYGFDLAAYYSAGAQCNKEDLADRMPDWTTMLIDKVMPTCYFNIETQKAKPTKSCAEPFLSVCDSGFKIEDFHPKHP